MQLIALLHWLLWSQILDLEIKIKINAFPSGCACRAPGKAELPSAGGVVVLPPVLP